MEHRRLACIFIPDFPLEVFTRDHPEYLDQPVVVAERDGDSSPLAVVNEKARAAGVSLEMTVAQAKSRCPGLIAVTREYEREDEESGKLIRLIQNIGPFIEEEIPGMYFLEVSGLMRLYRTETSMARKLINELHATDYPLQIGVATNKLVARIAAGIADINTYEVVPSGKEREFLAPLEVDHLLLPIETSETLHDLGITTVGQLASFPAHEITHRFGEEVIALAQYARGEDPALFVPEQLSGKLSDRLVLDYPVYDSAGLIRRLEPLLEKLLRPMVNSGRGCRALLIQCKCDDHSIHTVRVTVDQATASMKVFLRQMHRTFETYRFPSGVIEMIVAIPSAVSVVSEQLDLDRERTATGDGALPVSDLKDYPLYGVERQPRPLPEEGFVLIPYPLPKQKRAGSPGDTGCDYHPYALRPVFGLRLVSPVREATVDTDHGQLRRLKLKNRRQVITRQSGPWKLSGGWWHHGKTDNDTAGFDRLYYEVETDHHQVFLLFYDRLTSRWYLQGIFD